MGSWRPHVRCVTHLECPDSWCSWFCASARGAETPPESSPDPSLLPPLSWAISQDYRRIIPGVILRLYKDLDWSNTVPAKGFPGGTEVKKIHLPVQETKETRVRSRVRKIAEGGNGNPLQNSCLETPMDRGNWQATVHGVAKSQTQMSDWAQGSETESLEFSVAPGVTTLFPGLCGGEGGVLGEEPGKLEQRREYSADPGQGFLTKWYGNCQFTF